MLNNHRFCIFLCIFVFRRIFFFGYLILTIYLFAGFRNSENGEYIRRRQKKGGIKYLPVTSDSIKSVKLYFK